MIYFLIAIGNKKNTMNDNAKAFIYPNIKGTTLDRFEIFLKGNYLSNIPYKIAHNAIFFSID